MVREPFKSIYSFRKLEFLDKCLNCVKGYVKQLTSFSLYGYFRKSSDMIFQSLIGSIDNILSIRICVVCKIIL